MKEASRTTLTDPYSSLPVRQRQNVTVYIAPEVHEFFARRLFGGSPGAFASVINTLIDKLHQELKKENITQWEIDNEQRVNAVLERTNFRSAVAPAVKRAARGRSNLPPAVAPQQPADSGSNAGAAA